MFQTDFFDFPWKDDTMSKPLKAWKRRIPRACSGPMAETTSGVHLVFLCQNPKNVKAKLHQGGHNRSDYDDNVCVIVVNYQGFVSLFHCLLGMKENM